MSKPKKLASIPPEWARLSRQTAATMLAAEKKALSSYRAAVAEATAHVATAVRHAPDPHHATSIIRATNRALAARLAQAILASRHAARAAALARLAVALKIADAQLRALGFRAGMAPPSSPVGSTSHDVAHAEHAAQSFASAWGAGALRAIHFGDDIARELDALPAQLDYRVRRIAATEVPRAFNDEADDGIGWVAGQHADARWIVALVKVWDATIDRATCRYCADMDGRWALPGMSWGGDGPGDAHPHCRCITAVMLIPAMLPRGAAAGSYRQDDEVA